jgi:hypothetical protein
MTISTVLSIILDCQICFLSEHIVQQLCKLYCQFAKKKKKAKKKNFVFKYYFRLLRLHSATGKVLIIPNHVMLNKFNRITYLDKLILLIEWFQKMIIFLLFLFVTLTWL